ncbi:MAG: hypothetical protein EOO77_38235 [Oxalobacteraceae bacterium]|nr:MAG: hypothetical protein EOO77_38235 [Oxalobacteraceae bacterium]
MVDIELDPDHYDLAVDISLDVYRQRSQNAMEESFKFLDVQPDVAVYTLPKEVQEVRDIYRRTIGGTAGGATVDPFSLAYTSSLYQLGSGSNPGGVGGGGSQMSLATYELGLQYQELLGRMFGRDVQFNWNPATKKIMIQRRFQAQEEIALQVYNTKPEEVLLADPYARPWLRSYTLAQCKLMLGEAYSKYSGLAGPGGGITLKGDALKAEGQTEIEKLEKEIYDLVDGHSGYGFVIG